MKKRALVIILAIAMVVSYIPTTTINAISGAPAQNEPVQAEESIDAGGGSGSAEDPVDVSEESKDTSDGSEAENASDDPAEESSDEQEQEEPEQDKAEQAQEDPDRQTEADDADSSEQIDGAEFIKNDDTEAADVQGEAASGKSAAETALAEETDLSLKKIEKVVNRLFAAPEDGEETGEGSDGKKAGSETDDSDDPAGEDVPPPSG